MGIGTDVSLSAVRRRLARQLRESVELPFLPSPTQLDRSGLKKTKKKDFFLQFHLDGDEQLEMPLPRAAFCILADVPTRVCELMYSAAPSHTGLKNFLKNFLFNQSFHLFKVLDQEYYKGDLLMMLLLVL